MGKEFFTEAKEQSEVKSAIVRKYFKAWANVIKKTVQQHGNRIVYLDLFAGPGRYEDGTTSTPLLVLQEALDDPDLRKMLVTIFNDRDTQNSRTLETEIAKIPDISRLTHKPIVYNEEIGTEVVKQFETTNMAPTLFFVDPWGYKGLSLKLINSVLKDWACECIFFFNYTRINMGLSNPIVHEHMDALFGAERAATLRPTLEGLSATNRELAIVENICLALQEMGGKYVLPFRFKRPDGSRTSHHLIFVSKHARGYTIMKSVMAKESSGDVEGVPTFEYNAAFRKEGLLFELARHMDDLGDMLTDEYAGQTMTMLEVFDKHNLGRPFIESNYKEALRRLERDGRITCDPPAENRPKRQGVVTFADKTNVTFPEKGKDADGTVKH